MSKEPLTIEPLADELFRLLGHRTNAYYIYDNETGVPRVARGETRFGNYRDLPLTVDVIKKHLDGEITIGILPHNLEDECIFMTVDIDYHKDAGDDKSKIKTNYKDAKRIRKHLWKKYKRIALIEKSGSKSSYHVWTFFKPTPGSEVRKFGLHILKELGLSTKGKNKVELYPKQDKASTTPEKYGTMIKCPCGIHRKSERTSRFLMPEFIGEPLKGIRKVEDHEILSQYFSMLDITEVPVVHETKAKKKNKE